MASKSPRCARPPGKGETSKSIPATLHVKVGVVSGSHNLELQLPSSGRVSNVIDHVADAWCIPQLCQQLVLDDRLLSEVETLISILKPGEKSLNLLMVVSVDTACKQLESRHVSAQMGAMQALCKVAVKGDERLITALSARLHDRNAHVRLVAVEMLGAFVEQDDQVALDKLRACLEDGDADVRLAAVEALAAAAGWANKPVISSLTTCLDDVEPDIRWAAAEALHTIADTDDECLIKAKSVRQQLSRLSARESKRA